MKIFKNVKTWWALVLGWMCLIFFMSNQPGNVSSGQSEFVVKILNFIGLNLQSGEGTIVTFIIRKAAHFSEYMILFLFTYKLLKFYTKNNDARMFAILIAFAYACTDEVHQLFIPGRSGMFKDVLIDTSGALTLGILTFVCDKFCELRLKKSRYNK